MIKKNSNTGSLLYIFKSAVVWHFPNAKKSYKTYDYTLAVSKLSTFVRLQSMAYQLNYK